MFIKIENIKYHIEIKGEGNPIICLHGFSEDVSTWKLLDLHGYKLILIDLIGHGKSDKPKESKYYSLEVMLKHLNKLISKLNLKKYSILGYSMGGRCALAYTLTYPNELNKLILESASYGEEKILNRLKRRKEDLNLAKSIRENGIEWFNEYWGSLSIFESQKVLPKSIMNDISRRRLANSTYALSNTLESTGQGNFPCLKDEIVKLSMPILYISGEYDKKYQKIGREFEVLNTNVKHIFINRCGHNTHIENINGFVEVLNKFL